MTQAYLLIPGLLLPADASAALTSASLQTLQELTAGCAAPLEQTLCLPEQSACPHLVWAWRVLTRSPNPFATAPYRWLIDNGPRLGGEIWRLTILSLTPAGRVIGKALLGEAQIEAISRALRSPLANSGFTLQRWDKVFYLTRKSTWNIVARETETLSGQMFMDKAHIACVDRDDTATARQAYETLLSLNEILTSLQIAGADALWIDGGGKAEDFYPPTKIRSVLADDPAVLGWAQASGILNHRTAKASGASCWPNDAPNGECIAILSPLYEAWLACDWVVWQTKLIALAKQVKALREAAHKRGCDELLLVACGMVQTKSFQAKLLDPRSLLARLTTPKSLNPSVWVTEG